MVSFRKKFERHTTPLNVCGEERCVTIQKNGLRWKLRISGHETLHGASFFDSCWRLVIRHFCFFNVHRLSAAIVP